MTRPAILFINEYGIYPELITALREAGYPLTVEHLMRNAIKHIRKHKPAIVVAEFAHESHFRDRVSNLESMLAQVERGGMVTRTVVFYEPDKQPYLDRVKAMFTIDRCLRLPLDGEALVAAIESLDSRTK